MWPYLKSLIMDEGKFVGSIRAVLGAGGLAIQSGYTDVLPPWAGLLCVGAALFMRSSAGNGKAKQDSGS